MKYRAAVLTFLTLVSVAMFMSFSLPVGSGLMAQPRVLAQSIPRTHGQVTQTEIDLRTDEAPGTIIISNKDFTLDFVLGNGRALRYQVGVGRDGFRWTGISQVGRKAEWPDWRPPEAMRARMPGLPEILPAGPNNPLGARAIYLFQNGHDTLYRIHGTNNVGSIAGHVSSGCFRLSNADAMDLYKRVKLGARVIVR